MHVFSAEARERLLQTIIDTEPECVKMLGPDSRLLMMNPAGLRMIQADDAARRILRGLQKGKFEIVFPWQMTAMMKFARLLPYPAYFWLVRNVIAKQASEPES